MGMVGRSEFSMDAPVEAPLPGALCVLGRKALPASTCLTLHLIPDLLSQTLELIYSLAIVSKPRRFSGSI